MLLRLLNNREVVTADSFLHGGRPPLMFPIQVLLVFLFGILSLLSLLISDLGLFDLLTIVQHIFCLKACTDLFSRHNLIAVVKRVLRREDTGGHTGKLLLEIARQLSHLLLRRNARELKGMELQSLIAGSTLKVDQAFNLAIRVWHLGSWLALG